MRRQIYHPIVYFGLQFERAAFFIILIQLFGLMLLLVQHGFAPLFFVELALTVWVAYIGFKKPLHEHLNIHPDEFIEWKSRQ